MVENKSAEIDGAMTPQELEYNMDGLTNKWLWSSP